MAKKTPRYYQLDAKRAIYQAWREPEKVPYVDMVTGSGKALLWAMVGQDILSKSAVIDNNNFEIKPAPRGIFFVPNKKLVMQNYSEIVGYVDNQYIKDIGIACNKLHKMETKRRVVIAMTQSFYSHRAKAGAFDFCCIDECSLVSPDEKTQIRKIIRSLLRQNPNMKIAGSDGSPYRDDQGALEDKCKKGNPLFTHCVYRTPVSQMIHEGYLSPIKNISGTVEMDLTGVRITGKDYNTKDLGVKFDAILVDAVADFKQKCEIFDIKTAVLFTSTIENAYKVVAEWGNDTEIRVSHGELTDTQLEANLHWLEHGNGRRILLNVGLYIRGFDYTALQCVGFFLATKVLSKYVQIIGRVIRAHADKDHGYVWDCGTNISRHGAIDDLTPPKKKTKTGDKPQKLCTNCDTLNDISAKSCVSCGCFFVVGEDGNYSLKSKAEILRSKWQTVDVHHISYDFVMAKKTDKPMIRIEYYDEFNGLIVKLHLCLDHTGVAQTIAQQTLIGMFKNKRDFYALSAAEGLNCADVCKLLDDAYDDYFKKVKSVTVGEQVNNPKYKEVKKINYLID